MAKHVRPGDWIEFLKGQPTPRRAKEAVSHLLRGCQPCRATAKQSRLSRKAVRRNPLPSDLSQAYDAALDRVADFARRVQELPRNERVHFHKALSLLASGEGVVALARADMDVAGLAVYEALLARSRAVRFDDPKEMCDLAWAAVEVAEGFDPAEYGADGVADLQARAWGELGNALRTWDKLDVAGQAFDQAFALLKRGTGDRSLKARLLDLEGSLLGTRREFSTALTRLEIVPDLYRDLGEDRLAGKVLIKRAVYSSYSGQLEEPVRLNLEGIRLLDQSLDSDVMAAALLNHFGYLVEASRFEEARMFLFKNRGTVESRSRIGDLKLRWYEGRLFYGLRQWASAEIAFKEIKEGFKSLDMIFHFGLAGLDLAMVFMQQGRIDEAEQEVLASSNVFVALNIRREILSSVIFLEEVFRIRKATIRLVEDTIHYIRQKFKELGGPR